jgi:hypothetical protein
LIASQDVASTVVVRVVGITQRSMFPFRTSNQTVSGNADILYSSIALDRLVSLARYQTVSWHEL